MTKCEEIVMEMSGDIRKLIAEIEQLKEKNGDLNVKILILKAKIKELTET